MSERGRLLKILAKRSFSFDTIDIVSEKMDGLSDSIKEKMSVQMLAILQESKTEQEFIIKLEELAADSSEQSTSQKEYTISLPLDPILHLDGPESEESYGEQGE